METITSFCDELKKKPFKAKKAGEYFDLLPRGVKSIAFNAALSIVLIPKKKPPEQRAIGYSFFQMLFRLPKHQRNNRIWKTYFTNPKTLKKLKTAVNKQKSVYESTKFTKPQKRKKLLDLSRFLKAQNEENVVTGQSEWVEALEEIHEGEKIGCWIWFIFPTPTFLGPPAPSARNKYFSLGSDKDGTAQNAAKAYLSHPVLGNRLKKITEAVFDQLKKGRSVAQIFKGDKAKFLSSMRLFAEVSKHGNIFVKVLNLVHKPEKPRRKAPKKSSRKPRTKRSEQRSKKAACRREKFAKEFQRWKTLDEDDPLTLFYKSLYREKPSSKMAITWLVKRGFFSGQKRLGLVKKYKKL